MKLLTICTVVLTLLLAGCKVDDIHEDVQLTPPKHPQYFDMTIDLNREKNAYEVETTVTLLKETSRMINLQFTLQEISTSTLSNQILNLISYEEELFNGTWKVGEEKQFEIVLPTLPKGEYDLQVQALTEEDENRGRWGGLATIRLKTNESGEVIEKRIDIITDH